MIVKAVTLFLVAIAVLGMFGKLRLPKQGLRLPKPAKCRQCGAPIPGKGPCPCTTKT